MPYFSVTPVNRPASMGYWVKAESQIEARRLISLNVANMKEAVNENSAACDEDATHQPSEDIILEGSGTTHTIHRR